MGSFPGCNYTQSHKLFGLLAALVGALAGTYLIAGAILAVSLSIFPLGNLGRLSLVMRGSLFTFPIIAVLISPLIFIQEAQLRMDGIWRIVNTARITLGLKRSLNPGVKGCGVGRLSRRGNGGKNSAISNQSSFSVILEPHHINEPSQHDRIRFANHSAVHLRTDS